MFRPLFLFLLGLSLVCGTPIVVKRWMNEKHLSGPQVAITVVDLSRLAALSGQGDEAEFFAQFKRRTGFSTLIVDEQNLDDLVNQGKVTVFSGAQLINFNRTGFKSFAGARPDRLYIWISDRLLFDRVEAGLRQDLGTAMVNVAVSGLVLEVSGTWDDLKWVGLGVDPALLLSWKSQGWRLALRLRNGANASDSFISAKSTWISSLAGVESVLFSSDAVWGHPSAVGKVATQLKRHGLHYGNIEFSDQLGSASLAKAYPDGFLRVHSITEAELPRYSPDQAVARFVRAAKERNVKILVVHPYWTAIGQGGIVGYNLSYFKHLTQALRDQGLVSGADRSVGLEIFFPRFLALGIGLGAVSAAFLVLSFFSSLSFMGVMAGYGLLGAAFFFVPEVLFRSGVGLLSAMVFPILTWLILFRNNKEGFALARCGIAFLSFSLGVILLVGVLSTPAWLSGALVFSGVKAALFFPMLFLVFVVFFRNQKWRFLPYIIRRWMNRPMTLGGILWVLGLGIGGLLLFYRSGNGASVSGHEYVFRDTLELFFGVRPRLKDILGIGFLVLGFLWRKQRVSVGFQFLGMLGLVSLMNSFCHLHTPLWVTLYRSALGIGIGYSWAVLVVGIKRFFRKGVLWIAMPFQI